MLGAGGAARAVIHALGRAGASEVIVVNRSAAAAERAAGLGGAVGRAAGPEAVAHADLVVNATPLGMRAYSPSAMPCDPALVAPGAVVVDLIYDPLETPWLAALRARHVQVSNGLSMLVHQAALQFERWTGIDAPVAVMRAAVHGLLVGPTP